MHGSTVQHRRITPGNAAASGVAALLVHSVAADVAGIAIPRPQAQIVVRFGPLGNDLDVHALGSQRTVRRKPLKSGQRVVMARLQLGTQAAVLGVPASVIAGRLVPLAELWGGSATDQLLDKLAASRGLASAAVVLEQAIAERLSAAGEPHLQTPLAVAAAERLGGDSVRAVAGGLGVSERHLRRVFQETVGLSPKAFARLARFRRALQAALEDGRAGWAEIAAGAGYYDQAHLIAECRAIAGVTPAVLREQLRMAGGDPLPAYEI